MKVKIDLKILVFLAIFCFTKQLEIYIIIMFFCFLHELGHILVGVIMKMKIENLEIMPFGLSTSFKVDFDDLDRKVKNGNILEIKKIIVSIAGPIFSLVFAILCTYIDIPCITKQDAIYSNLLIFSFNLIPLYPLDGGRIIKGILHIQFGIDKSIELIKSISNITIIILTVISSIAIYYLKNIAIFLMCIFLWNLILQEKNGKILDILWRK